MFNKILFLRFKNYVKAYKKHLRLIFLPAEIISDFWNGFEKLVQFLPTSLSSDLLLGMVWIFLVVIGLGGIDRLEIAGILNGLARNKSSLDEYENNDKYDVIEARILGEGESDIVSNQEFHVKSFTFSPFCNRSKY